MAWLFYCDSFFIGQNFLIGSNVRKDHPLFAQRIRQAIKRGAKVTALLDKSYDWAFPVEVSFESDSIKWVEVLASIAFEIAISKNISIGLCQKL